MVDICEQLTRASPLPTSLRRALARPRRAFGDRFRFRVQGGGLQLIADLPDELPAGDIERRAAAQGICARAVAVYCHEVEPPNALHLGFAAVREPEIWPAVQQLHESIVDLL
jgi:DNA-binding transcriptional MocR family regulator